MSSLPAAIAQRFMRRTSLDPDEYRINFRQIDCDVIAAVTSEEASMVTAQMSKVYLCLVNAPSCYWERDGVLRFAGEEKEGKWQTAWEQLVSLVGVASATARKALAWMSGQAIIGYYAGRNGAGIRIFINRASSSIGRRAPKRQKNLHLIHASTSTPHTSQFEARFNDSFAVIDTLETDLNPHAPKNSAEPQPVAETRFDSPPKVANQPHALTRSKQREVEVIMHPPGTVLVKDLIERLRSELEPCVKAAAAQAATREGARTREWFETRALPKAIRVAQHETYDLLRKHGHAEDRQRRTRADLEVGAASALSTPPEAHACTPEEITEAARMCLALLEVQGQAIEVTLCEASAAGGWLLAEDVPAVRAAAALLMVERSGGG